MSTPHKKDKSPFLVQSNFISPLACEQILEGIPKYSFETQNPETAANKISFEDVGAPYLHQPIADLIPQIESHYGTRLKSFSKSHVEWFTVGSTDKLKCDNSIYYEKKWVKNVRRDFSCILFLSDYNPKPPFDKSYEVYGGKFEFPQHGFSFQPIRGTLIVYPSGPHFINYTTEIKFGDLYQIRFFFEAQTDYMHSPADFPGDFTTWF
jgi:hypothetical protein